MGRVVLHQSALRQLERHPAILARVRSSVGDPILTDATPDVPVDSGTLRDSGFVETGEDRVRIGYDTEYASIVHEGAGIGRNATPRPFLARAAVRPRGEIR